MMSARSLLLGSLAVAAFGCGSHSLRDGGGGGDDAQSGGPDSAVADAPGDSRTAAECTGHGMLDPSFGTGGVAGPVFGSITGKYVFASAVAIDDQQRIVVVGAFSRVPRACVVARFLPDGTLDPSFGNGAGIVNNGVGNYVCSYSSVALQADGKIVVGGYLEGNPSRALLMRYLADGNLDAEFGENGIVLADPSASDTAILGVDIDAAQRIVVAQQSSDVTGPELESHFDTRRYLSDGALDTSFGTAGTPATAFTNGFDTPFDVRVQPDGKLIVVGGTSTPQFTHQDFAAVRFTPDGQLDTSFAQSGLADIAFEQAACAFSVAIDPLGRSVLAGSQSNRGAVLRMTPDGSPDPSFGTGGEIIEGSLGDLTYSAVAIDQEGNIVTVGTSGALEAVRVARYTTTGALDTSFGSDGFAQLATSGYLQHGRDIAIQSDGRIVVVGGIGDNFSSDFLVARFCP
jgi:uncharacterized delta-60 repeat protein